MSLTRAVKCAREGDWIALSKKKCLVSMGHGTATVLVRFLDAEDVNPLRRGAPSRVAVRDTVGEAGSAFLTTLPAGYSATPRWCGRCGQGVWQQRGP